MKKDLTLVLMAAGMGSRFGGLKQIEPMGPNGEFLIDYSIYDALKVGITKVVFIIKEENYEIFKETIGKRVESHIPVEYVFQKIDNVPSFVNIPEDRVKPWGTAHAIYCTKDAVTTPFITINADDFYGRDAFRVAAEFLQNASEKSYANVGYKVTNTMTENGSVKRGVLETEDGKLTSLIESKIERNESGKIIAEPLSGAASFEVNEDALVSMNMLCFDPSLFPYLEEKMDKFFKDNENDLSSCEFLIPDVMNDANNEGYATTTVLNTDAVWYGVTYKEDTQNVRKSLKELVDKGVYPNDLWR